MERLCFRALFCTLLGVATATLAAAQNPGQEVQATEEKVAELQREITAIQQRISHQEGERDALLNRLRSAEIDISRLDQSLREVENSISREEAGLKKLEKERVALQHQVETERATMGDEIRNLWGLQQGGGIRVLFGDQSPDNVARNLAYYRRLLTTRNNSIQRFAELLDRVEQNSLAIENSREQLAQRRSELGQQRQRALTLQKEREATLAALERSLDSDARRVEALEADAKQLSILLEELRGAIAALDTPPDYQPFTAAQGEMSYPIPGEPGNRYGGPRNAGSMRWRGWLMPAREGSEVAAIHHGRVVYADWLRGQGLLLILDHGEGYLSLYGHNRSLQREVGDWVKAGEVIATVGASGGADQPALYFEIRHNGQPVNPGNWVKR